MIRLAWQRSCPLHMLRNCKGLLLGLIQNDKHPLRGEEVLQVSSCVKPFEVKIAKWAHCPQNVSQITFEMIWRGCGVRIWGPFFPSNYHRTFWMPPPASHKSIRALHQFAVRTICRRLQKRGVWGFRDWWNSSFWKKFVSDTMINVSISYICFKFCTYLMFSYFAHLSYLLLYIFFVVHVVFLILPMHCSPTGGVNTAFHSTI